MVSCGECVSVTSDLVSYNGEDGVSLCVYVCVCDRGLVLSGQQRALGQCHAPCSSLSWARTCPNAGVDPRGALPQYSSINGCANLATML